MATDEKPSRLRFDPTINAGHVLTFLSMAAGLMFSYSLLDKRVGVLEERSNSAMAQAADKATEQREALKEIKNDVKDLQRTVNDIGRNLMNKK